MIFIEGYLTAYALKKQKKIFSQAQLTPHERLYLCKICTVLGCFNFISYFSQMCSGKCHDDISNLKSGSVHVIFILNVLNLLCECNYSYHPIELKNDWSNLIVVELPLLVSVLL